MTDKRYNLIDVMSNVSGMSKETVNSIFEAVKSNTALLNSCPGPHDFEDTKGTNARSVYTEMRCRRCGGVLNRMHAIWYAKGVEHGMKTASRGTTHGEGKGSSSEPTRGR